MAHGKVYCAAILAIMIAFMPFASAAEYKDKATIKKVQETLNARGYDCGTPDGISGKKTKNAIVRYQEDNKLDVTGTVTDKLWESLGPYREVGAQIPSDSRLPELDRQYFYDHPHIWAGCVFYQAMLKLTDEGVLEADPLTAEYPLKKNADGAFPMVFKDRRAGKKLTDPGFKIGPGRVMICREDFKTSYSDEKVKGMPNWGLYRRRSDGTYGYPDMRKEDENTLYGNVGSYRPTEYIDSCDYVIAMGGYTSIADEDFYSSGFSRFGKTMIVFVIDARNLTCVHIECVSTSLPGNFTSDNYGTLNYPSAEEYVIQLLEDE